MYVHLIDPIRLHKNRDKVERNFMERVQRILTYGAKLHENKEGVERNLTYEAKLHENGEGLERNLTNKSRIYEN